MLSIPHEFSDVRFQEPDLQIVFYIWATVAITLFTLAFIFSYETESGYRHTLQIAVLSLGWPCALVVIAVAFATVTFLEFRRAGMHLAAARTCDAARSHLRQKAGAGHRASPVKDVEADAGRR
jgi:hypothetical protein